MAREAVHVVRRLADLCKSMNIKCVVQIGAEDGYEAAEIQEATGCRAVCIDPDPRTVKCSPRIEFFRVMIGPEDAIAHFYINETMGLSGAIPRGGHEQHIAVEQLTLDTFCTSMSITPDALIIDTEGTIMDVLGGADLTLPTVRLIYGEAYIDRSDEQVGSVVDVDKYLGERGFVRRDGPPSYTAPPQGNYVWVRP